MEAIDLQGLKEWPESEQKQARELLLKWEHLFAYSNLDLGKTALIKHKVRLTEQTPYKERYRCIPPHMYDDMRAHIQGMLDIGAIHKLHSPWVRGECSGVGSKKGWWLEVLYRPQETK